ncbi:MAG TPA: phosphopantetheine-binding protein, partial [Pirellulales bacterium]
DEAAGSDRARRRIVGCGRPNAWQKVRVVDPLTQLECEAGEPGEIWVHGPSVAKGYWNAPVETERTFNGRLADLSPDNGESLAYLRTGDLGFYRDGELFVVDRIKDLIVVNGRNVSPQDVEWAAREADPTVQTAAAFAVATESGERPALAVELVRRGACEPEQFFATLRRSVASLCEVELQGIVLLPPGALPRTTSGKVRRSACRQAFLSRDLKEFARWEAPLAPAAMRASADPLEPRPGPSAGELRDWLIGRVAARLGTPAKAIDPQAAFLTLGLDSVEAMSLSGELEEHLGRRLSPVLFYNYPTIASLAEKLAEAPKTACRSGATTPSAATAPHGSYAPPATNASTPASSPAAASASAAPAGTPSNGADDGQMLREVQAMSDAEIEAMIADLSQKSLQQNW